MTNNEVDIITYFDAKFNSLKEYFDEKFKNMDSKFSDLKSCEENDFDLLEGKLSDHESRIKNLENIDGKKAISILNTIKENLLKFAVPSLIILVVYLLGTGELLKILGIK